MTTLRIVKTPDGTTRCRIRVDPPLCLVCGGVWNRIVDVECCPTVCLPRANRISARLVQAIFIDEKEDLA